MCSARFAPYSLRLIVALTLVGVLGACSLEPAMKPVDPRVASQYPGADATSVEAELPDWKAVLREPRLQALVDIALRNNPDVRVAALNLKSVRAQYRIQRAALAPELAVESALQRGRTPAELGGEGVYSEYSVGLGASWELDFFGRLNSLRRAALREYLATEQAHRAAHLALVAQVADQYLALRAYDAQLAVTHDTLDNAQASYALVKLGYEAGTRSELDLREAEGILEQVRANLAQQTRLQAQAHHALVVLLGAPLPDDLPPPGPLLDDDQVLNDIEPGLPSALLARRPDILAAEQRLRAANARIGAARAAFFPSISLTGTVGTASNELSGLFGSGSGAWLFAPRIDLPIFDAGARRASLDLAETQREIAVAQYQQAIQIAFREVADGLAARSSYRLQLEAQHRYVVSAQRRLELAQLRYSNGVDSYLSVLSAQTDLYTARQSLISTQLARLTNLVDLYRSLGGGWTVENDDVPLAAMTPVR